jgi:hypothetical protein
MNAFSATAPVALPPRQTAFDPLRVVVLYDGLDAAYRAHDVVTGLTMALRGQRRVDSSLWSFDMLARLDIRHASVRGAADADVLVVVAAANEPLPNHVMTWLMACVRENEKGVPLLGASYEDDPRHAYAVPALRRDLQAIAQRWKMLLMRECELTARLRQQMLPKLPPRNRSPRNREELEALLSNTQRRGWGIND